MRIALHDADKTNFPNLALMKLSAHHKAIGDTVEWWNSFIETDKVLSSKVFTFSHSAHLPLNAISGGTGTGTTQELPEEIEHSCPDYNLYGIDYSMGFLTRGCPHKCKHCFVPDKEGGIREHADIEEFCKHNKAVLLDNNVLAHRHGITQIEKIARLGIRVDFNQGLDARLIDTNIARRLSDVKWLTPLRLACDSLDMMKHIQCAVTNLRWHNVTPRRYSCYVLVKDIESALERVRFLKGLNVDPFAQPYIDRDGTQPPKELRFFARWVNHKAEYKSRTWEEYRDAKKQPEGGFYETWNG